MPNYAEKLGGEHPFTVANKAPIPFIDGEEGLPPGALDIAYVDNSKKFDQNWSDGMPWYDRLHAHATLNSARRNAKCKRPFEPKDELDFVMSAAYCPTAGVFFEKTDPYIQIETALGEDMNYTVPEQLWKQLTGGKGKAPLEPIKKTWRVMRNRFVIFPIKGNSAGAADNSPAKGNGRLSRNVSAADSSPTKGNGSLSRNVGAADSSPTKGNGSLSRNVGAADNSAVKGNGNLSSSDGVADNSPTKGNGNLSSSDGVADNSPTKGNGNLSSNVGGADNSPTQGNGNIPSNVGGADNSPTQGNGNLSSNVGVADYSHIKGYDVAVSNGGVARRGNIYNVKLGIAADHTPQTNPGYSRTPCGAFYSI